MCRNKKVTFKKFGESSVDHLYGGGRAIEEPERETIHVDR